MRSPDAPSALRILREEVDAELQRRGLGTQQPSSAPAPATLSAPPAPPPAALSAPPASAMAVDRGRAPRHGDDPAQTQSLAQPHRAAMLQPDQPHQPPPVPQHQHHHQQYHQQQHQQQQHHQYQQQQQQQQHIFAWAS